MGKTKIKRDNWRCPKCEASFPNAWERDRHKQEHWYEVKEKS